MENMMLAIVTNDKEYGRSLSLGMLSICRTFIIRIFGAEEFLKEKRDYDLILWDGEEVKEVYGGRIIYLAEKPSEAVRNISEKRFCLYKYSSAAVIVAAIFEIYETVTGRRAVNLKRQNVRLFAFSSFAGGTGCTTVAMAAAQEFCRFREKKVFYISFEEMESVGDIIRCSSGIKGAGVYLYELFNNIYSSAGIRKTDENSRPFIESYVVKDDYGVEAFSPGNGRNPLKELNPDEFRRFIASVIDSGRYEVIIADMGQCLSRTALKCLEMAEKICMVCAPASKSDREQKYIAHLLHNCGEEIMDKVIKVENKRKNDIAGFSMTSVDTEVFSVSFSDSFVDDDGRIGMILEGEFGNDINGLVKLMVDPQ